ncbi:dynein regulatory complex subunit 5 isoform X4 [Canis lupus baileyi]|uniref:dynein regulatory complex subunit 5 isoform X4 n=1 Tax=Canis lupus dingo TaxID=286419 RepID=UPI0020C5733B|nr:dynein regulatory complex subunit 5 isoform X4 [Canis lupus dingo]
MQETLVTPTLSVLSRSSITMQDRSSTAGQASSTGPQPSRPSVIPPPSKSKGWKSGANVRRMRRIIAEDPEWSLAIVPLLTELCIQHIVENFQNNPILKQLLPEHQQKVLNHLSPDLPLTVTANLIDDENYWRRCCMQRWPVCHVARHGGSWKRLFFERHLENLIKHFIPSTTDPAVILDLLPFCRNYVRRLRVDQFLPPVQLPLQPWNGELSDSGSEAEMEQPTGDHYQLRDLVAGLSHLEELDLVYGVKDCGMNFEWNLFLFTYQDCHSLAATIKACHTLKTFRLTRSKVDDDKARILIRSLLDHPALEELDLSHNLIGDRGARAAAKLLSHSHLRVLTLANNQVLTVNTTLTSINLSCNHIGLDGGKQLLEECYMGLEGGDRDHGYPCGPAHPTSPCSQHKRSLPGALHESLSFCGCPQEPHQPTGPQEDLIDPG